MLTTAFISMWITNTATTAMMTPIMEAVLKELDKEYMAEAIEENEGNMDENGDNFEAAVRDQIKNMNTSDIAEKKNGVHDDEVELKELGLHDGPSRCGSTKQLVEL